MQRMDCDDFDARLIAIISVITSHPQFHSGVGTSNHFGSKSKGISHFDLSACLQNFIFMNRLVKAI